MSRAQPSLTNYQTNYQRSSSLDLRRPPLGYYQMGKSVNLAAFGAK